MKQFKKLIAAGTLLSMFAFNTASVQAYDYATDAGGYGYADSYTSPKLAPTIALGTIAVVAIIAVAVQNSRGHSGHGHS